MDLGVRSPGSPRESKVKGDMLLSEGMSTAAAFRNLNRCCAVWSFQRVDPGQIGWSEERAGRSKSIAAAEGQCSLGHVWKRGLALWGMRRRLCKLPRKMRLSRNRPNGRATTGRMVPSLPRDGVKVGFHSDMEWPLSRSPRLRHKPYVTWWCPKGRVATTHSIPVR